MRTPGLRAYGSPRRLRWWRTATNRALTGALAAVILGLSPLVPAPRPAMAAEVGPVAHQQLLAVYLYNFLYFTTWPPEKGTRNPEEPYIIGVVGDNALRQALLGLKASLAANGKKGIRLVFYGPYKPGQHYSGCHVLFISSSERSHYTDILTALNHAPVLTVSEDTGFLESGGMITFARHEDKLRYRINRAAVASAGLRLSSQLLKSALKADVNK